MIRCRVGVSAQGDITMCRADAPEHWHVRVIRIYVAGSWMSACVSFEAWMRDVHRYCGADYSTL